MPNILSLSSSGNGTSQRMEEASIAGTIDWNPGLRLCYSDCVGIGTHSVAATTLCLVGGDRLIHGGVYATRRFKDVPK